MYRTRTCSLVTRAGETEPSGATSQFRYGSTTGSVSIISSPELLRLFGHYHLGSIARESMDATGAYICLSAAVPEGSCHLRC